MNWWECWVVTVVATAVVAHPKDLPGVGGEADRVEAAEEGTGSPHHRSKRQGLDGYRFTVDGIKALENVDEMLRTTLPEVDRFQCLEHMACAISSFIFSSPPGGSSPGGFLTPGFDPSFQQGAILDPTTIQQSFSGLVQGQQGLQGLLQGQQGLLQGQQGILPGQQGLLQTQQGLSGLLQSGLSGLLQSPSTQQATQFLPAQPPPIPFHPQVHGSFPGLQGPGFQNTFPNFRENPEGRHVSQRKNSPSVVRRWRSSHRRRPQRRNSFMNVLRSLGKRKKRSVIDDILGGFTPDKILGLLDQMMEKYSFHPYTHAAYMGYTGDQCKQLYPSCPTTSNEMIDVFNNIHKYYPRGIPYKDNLPWPLNVLLP